MCIEGHRDPRHCIVPPHLLRVLEMRGDEKQAAMARSLLDQTAKVREARCAEAARVGSPMLRARSRGRVRRAGLRGAGGDVAREPGDP